MEILIIFGLLLAFAFGYHLGTKYQQEKKMPIIGKAEMHAINQIQETGNATMYKLITELQDKKKEEK